MYKPIVFLFLFIGSLAFAQEITWHRGSVVLTDQHVIVGDISVQTDELILVRNSQGNAVYPAHKIQLLRYYDEAAHINRKFTTLRDVETGFQQTRLYEIVVSGKLSVIRKQKVSFNNNDQLSDADDFEYYVDVEHNLTNLQHFRKKIYPHLIADSEFLQRYVSTEKLDANDLSDAIQIIIFYNKQLVSPTFAGLQP